MLNKLDVVKQNIRNLKLNEQEANDLRTWIIVDYIEEIKQSESAESATVQAYKTMRKNAIIPTPPVAQIPSGFTVTGEVYDPSETAVYIAGDRVLVDGRILQAQSMPKFPADFKAETWLDVTGLYQTVS